MPMSLDGLRAWIGEVERKLGARTRVFLVLVAIAIGASGAGIYLALEADGGGNTARGASTEEVQQLREQIQLQGGSQVSTLEAQIVELRTEIEDLKTNGASKGDGGTSPSGDESGKEETQESEAKEIPESEAKEIPESEATK
jgi:TolA-binding protein